MYFSAFRAVFETGAPRVPACVSPAEVKAKRIFKSKFFSHSPMHFFIFIFFKKKSYYTHVFRLSVSSLRSFKIKLAFSCVNTDIKMPRCVSLASSSPFQRKLDLKLYAFVIGTNFSGYQLGVKDFFFPCFFLKASMQMGWLP